MLIFACDLDFDPMTLVLELDLDMIVTYFYTKNEVKRPFGSKLIVRKQKQTDIQTYIHLQNLHWISPEISPGLIHGGGPFTSMVLSLGTWSYIWGRY